MERRSLDSTEFRRAKRCKTRAEYRTSKKETAVRVYTINDESRFLLVQNVSIFGDIEELAKRFAVFGPISKYCIFDEFERDDEYTNVLCFEYQNIADARDAKRKLNDYNFMSQLIHVTYAPQLESSDDTKTKLLGRRQRVLQRITQLEIERGTATQRPSSKNPNTTTNLPRWCTLTSAQGSRKK